MIKNKLFLLSIKELVEYLPKKESRICLFEGKTCWWWLRSPGYDAYSAAYVSICGYLDRNGDCVSSHDYAVRPALHLNLGYLNSLKKNKKGYVMFGNREWIVLDENMGLLLSKDAVCLHQFDKKNNNYETSEIQKYLNDELYYDMFSVEEQREIIGTFVNKETTFIYRQYKLMETDETVEEKNVPKSILVLDTPDECSMCEFMKMTGEGYCFCGRLGFDYQVNEYPFTPKGKLDCCPLKEMPQKYANISMDYERGYNACIEEILKS